MFGSKILFVIPAMLLFSSLLSCIGGAESGLSETEHAQGAPAPHIVNIVKGRLNVEGNLLSLRLCSDTLLLSLDSTDENLMGIIQAKQDLAKSADSWYVELDGRIETFNEQDSMPPRYAGRLLVHEVVSIRFDSTYAICQ